MNFSFDVLSQIANSEKLFSKMEAKLADYILADPNYVLTLSISELARNCGVSLATVTRFCRRLSLNGYQEFRLELMKSVSVIQGLDLNDPQDVTMEDSVPELISKVNIIHQQALANSMTALDPEQVSRAVALMENAQSVHFVGCGRMLLTAMNAKIQFMQISNKFHCDSDPVFQILNSSLMTEDNVCVIFSYSGATRDIIDIAAMAKSKGAKIIAVTRYGQSPLVELSDVVLICGVTEGPEQAGSAAAQIGMIYIIDVLYTEYFRRTNEVSQRNKTITSCVGIGRIPFKAKKNKAD